MADTLIEWADWSINPIKVKGGGYHCTKVSEGCTRCYAEVFNNRFGNHKPFDATHVEFELDERPFERLARARKSRRVFLQSMGDLFHEDVPDLLQVKVIEWVSKLPQHTFMILTKRPEGMDAWDYRSACWPGQKIDNWNPLPNLWLGVTVENDKHLDRVEYLRQIHAAVTFVSYEPALGPADFSPYLPGIDLVIAGGETGPGARPSHPDWFRKVRDDCARANVAFYFKSWGAHIPAVGRDEIGDVYFPPAEHDTSFDPFGDGTYMLKVNREIKHLTRLLDGVEHNELPEVPK